MKATPLPFISRMYFLFVMSPDTLAAISPAFAAVSVNFTGQVSFTTVAQSRPARGTRGTTRIIVRPAGGHPGSVSPALLPLSSFPTRKTCAAPLLPLSFVPVAYRSEPFCNRAADTWGQGQQPAQNQPRRRGDRSGPCEFCREENEMAQTWR